MLCVGYWAVIFPGNVLHTALSRGLSFTASLGWPVNLFFQQRFTHAQHQTEAYPGALGYPGQPFYQQHFTLHTASNRGLPSAGALGCPGQPFFTSNILHIASNRGLPSAGALGCLGQPFCQQSVTACAWRSAAWPPQHPRLAGPAARVCCSRLLLLPENTKAISNYRLLYHLQEAFSSTSTKVFTKIGQNSPLPPPSPPPQTKTNT